MGVVDVCFVGPSMEGYLVNEQVKIHSAHKQESPGDPKISVLMAVFNENPIYLKQAVQSILVQTFTSFELIIIDDGSDQEETVLVLEHFAKQNSRIRLFKESHQGLTKSLNYGLKFCRAKLICRHDSDDWSEPNRLFEQVRFLQKNPNISVVGSNIVLHQEKGNILWKTNFPLKQKSILAAFSAENPFCHGATCFRKTHANAVGGYREEFNCSQDYDFFWRLCEYSDGANLPEALYHHRRTSTAVSTQRSGVQAKVTLITRNLAKMRSDHGNEDFNEAVKQAKHCLPEEKQYLVTQLRNADNLLLAGHYVSSLKLYILTMIINPLNKRCLLKLLRWWLFVFVPPARESLFVRDMKTLLHCRHLFAKRNTNLERS